MWWKSALAFYAVLPAAATFYFVVFWRWFDYWKAHRTQSMVLVAGSFAGATVVLLVGRDRIFAGQIDPPAPVQALGWVLIAVSVIFGTVADRQIKFRVRSFTPFFERHGHLDLVTTGAYGVVRHPIYASGIVFQAGSLLVTGYPAVLFGVAVFGLGAVWFTRQEESRLVVLLDDPGEYERYRARVPALLPSVRPRRVRTAPE